MKLRSLQGREADICPRADNSPAPIAPPLLT
jgi:hypothetical protein